MDAGFLALPQQPVGRSRNDEVQHHHHTCKMHLLLDKNIGAARMSHIAAKLKLDKMAVR